MSRDEAQRTARVTPEMLESLPITYQAVIPESYIDGMGHMNVMWYTHLFAHALGGAWKLLGMTREYFVARQAGSFALKQLFSYLNEVRVGEHVTLRSRLIARSEKRLHMLHFMVKDEARMMAATDEVVVAHIDMRVRRSSPFGPEVAAALDRLLAEHSALAWPPPVSGALHP
ncbi:MAG TPA: thioesterase family protein [Pirellulales bacterium]|jgi:acyl-CoA thioester hydrolase|nr:thioesterase family protein [Pirellulales bacterium]